MKHNDFYSIAYIAIFGAFWGAVEVVLGNVLHILDVPFKGTILSACASTICLTCAYLLPEKKRLPILSIGIVALIVRTFSFGIFKVHILVSMLTLALSLQIVVLLLGYNFLSYIFAGALGAFSPYISSGLFFGLMMGKGMSFIYHGLIKEMHAVNYLFSATIVVLLTIASATLIVGASSGAAAFYLGKKLKHAAHV